MTIPNYITISRLLISPIFLFFYLKYEAMGISTFGLFFILLSLLTLLEISDVADGYLARKYHQVSDLGKLLDPMADSIARITIFLTFTVGLVQLPMILVFVFLYRDSVSSTLRTVCALRGLALAARWSGKIKAILQAISCYVILLLILFYSLDLISIEQLQTTSAWVVTFVAFYAVLSLLDYFYANRRHIQEMMFSESD